MLFIGVISKNVPSFDPANDDMMQNIRYIETWLAWHGRKITLL